jgi:hypothetical protein
MGEIKFRNNPCEKHIDVSTYDDWCQPCLVEERDALRARIAELEAKTRWIPVSERLPETNKSVLTLDQYGNQATLGYYPDDECGGFGMYPYEVTHWMPLSEPPEDTDADR